MLVLEGLFPFLSPRGWRPERLLHLRDEQVRFFGLTSMVLGLIGLFLYGERPAIDDW